MTFGPVLVSPAERMRDKNLDFAADGLPSLHLILKMDGLSIQDEVRAQYTQGEQDWDSVKDVISCLYRDEGMTLAEVKIYLLERHNFVATYELRLLSRASR